MKTSKKGLNTSIFNQSQNAKCELSKKAWRSAEQGDDLKINQQNVVFFCFPNISL